MIDNLFDVLYVAKTGKIKPDASLTDNLYGKKFYDAHSGVITTATGNPVSIVTNKAQNAISTLLSYSPKQSGSGDPSPQNIRLIEGWTEANLFGCGRNMLNPINLKNVTGHNDDYSDITFYKTGFNADFCTMYLPAGTYTISQTPVSGAFNRIADDSTGESIKNISPPSDTFTLSTGRTIRLRRANNAPAEVNIKDLRIFAGTADYPFTPYTQGANNTISLGGTYYGFNIDLERGVLRVTHTTKTYTGASYESWNYSESGNKRRVFIVLDGAKANANDFWSTIASGGGDGSYPDPWKMRTNGNTRPSLIIGVDNTIGSGSDWKALLSDTNMIVIYPLATPIELPLTPQTVALLAGNNTLWTDGDSLSVTYKAKK